TQMASPFQLGTVPRQRASGTPRTTPRSPFLKTVPRPERVMGRGRRLTGQSIGFRTGRGEVLVRSPIVGRFVYSCTAGRISDPGRIEATQSDILSRVATSWSKDDGTPDVLPIYHACFIRRRKQPPSSAVPQGAAGVGMSVLPAIEYDFSVDQDI